MVLLLLPSFRNPITTAHIAGRLARSMTAKHLEHGTPLLAEASEAVADAAQAPCKITKLFTT